MHTNGPQIVPVNVFGSGHITLADPLTLSFGSISDCEETLTSVFSCLRQADILGVRGKWENLKAIFL